MKIKFAYQNRKIKKMKDVVVSLYDLGFLRGYGVFDVCRTTKKGKIFLLDEHYERIKTATKKIGLKFNLSQKEFEKIIYQLMKKNGVKKTSVRTVVTGGVAKNGITFSGKENTMILLEKFVFPKKEFYEKGVKLLSLDFSRKHADIKHLDYLTMVANQQKKKKAKAYDFLYIKKKEVFESSTSNIFIVKKNKVYTPKNGVLSGTARNLVIKLLRKNKIFISEQKVTEKMLHNSDEVFLTATSKNVLPVTQIDREKIGSGQVGTMTKKIIKIFNDFESEY